MKAFLMGFVLAALITTIAVAWARQARLFAPQNVTIKLAPNL